MSKALCTEAMRQQIRPRDESNVASFQLGLVMSRTSIGRSNFAHERDNESLLHRQHVMPEGLPARAIITRQSE